VTEKLLNEDITHQIREVFGQLKEPVKMLFFGQKDGCDYCDDTRQIVTEVTALSDKLEMQVYDLQDDAETAKQYKVDKAPGIVIVGKDGDKLLDYGIRFAGIPSGHEFTSLIQDLLLVSGRDSGLNEDTRQFLKGVSKPVRLQVFVTPT
jgi:glutaredoxin-like protein